MHKQPQGNRPQTGDSDRGTDGDSTATAGRDRHQRTAGQALQPGYYGKAGANILRGRRIGRGWSHAGQQRQRQGTQQAQPQRQHSTATATATAQHSHSDTAQGTGATMDTHQRTATRQEAHAPRLHRCNSQPTSQPAATMSATAYTFTASPRPFMYQILYLPPERCGPRQFKNYCFTREGVSLRDQAGQGVIELWPIWRSAPT